MRRRVDATPRVNGPPCLRHRGRSYSMSADVSMTQFLAIVS